VPPAAVIVIEAPLQIVPLLVVIVGKGLTVTKTVSDTEQVLEVPV